MRIPFVVVLTFAVIVNLVNLRPTSAQGQHESSGVSIEDRPKKPLKGDLHYLDVKASTSDISAKPATLHLAVSGDGLIQGLLSSTNVELEPDVWSGKEEEEAWAEWSRQFEQRLFESWQKRSHTPGQVTLRLAIGPDRKMDVEDWGTMFPGAYKTGADDTKPAVLASPETRDQFMAEAQDCVDNMDKSWLSSHDFPPVKSKLKLVRMDITLGYDGEQFPRHSPLEFGALVRLHKDGSILVASMQGITLSTLQVTGGSTLIAGCSKEQMQEAIAGTLRSDQRPVHQRSHGNKQSD